MATDEVRALRDDIARRVTQVVAALDTQWPEAMTRPPGVLRH